MKMHTLIWACLLVLVAIPVQAQEKTPSLGIGREAIIEALNNGDTGFRFDPATVEAGVPTISS